ncbi:hypothetical protein [Spirosoma utsteinense]|uniref:Uncharacterized protein n=1 Tax=Spirosoma utsteinense TaxID=2585773 RepID=A0ABR6WFG1_9BACT|nr:hypothetical protein [Spirosoma utsteinense]MBC3788625.1 hypothetical protein [Spirosoma utsteinense]MBC3794756.1 hypothetical protein [Spirosoma utsteinense]
MSRFLLLSACILVAFLTSRCVRDFPATAPYTAPVNPGPGTGTTPSPSPVAPPKRLFVANDKVKLGIDLNMGGAITYLSEASSTVNMINNVDLGRQLQTSIYGGPYPYSVNGKQPVPQWINLGWNPVQTGDYFNHPARIVSYQQNQNQLYVKTIPLIWPLFDEPADCVMEHWIELRGNNAHVRCRITVNRTDTTQYEARTQETPCIYLNGPYYRFVTYGGNQPFTNDAVSEYTSVDNTTRYGTESWIALLNEQGRGVGLIRPGSYLYGSAYFGSTRTDGEFDQSSGYINNQDFMQIDYNGVHEYEYDLVVGSTADIRQFAYAQARPAAKPDYRFGQDRAGWHYYNVRDQGWPIQNELAIRWEKTDSSKANFRVMSPFAFWKAADINKIYIQAAFKTNSPTIRFTWRKPGEIDSFDIPTRTVDFPVVNDGQFRTYEINLAGAAGWDGAICQISLSPASDKSRSQRGSIVRIRSVTANQPAG